LVECNSNPARGPNPFKKFYESEGDFTGEWDAGQFSIFGAIEEKAGAEFGGSPEMQRRSNASDCPIEWGGFRARAARRKKLIKWAAGLSTGSAQEMQKGQGFRVLSFEF